MERGVDDADLVLMVTSRPTVGATMAWAVACERDQNGRPIAGQVTEYSLPTANHAGQVTEYSLPTANARA
eukprot:7846335-Pyramimonas_sp.AAC.2